MVVHDSKWREFGQAPVRVYLATWQWLDEVTHLLAWQCLVVSLEHLVHYCEVAMRIYSDRGVALQSKSRVARQ